MDIAVFGVGYVGAVVAGCMAGAGHVVAAVDVNPAKAATINAGRSPVTEPGLAELIRGAVEEGRLTAGTDPATAFATAELIFVCVGTPGLPNGKLDLSYVVGVAEDLGRRIAADRGRRRTVVVRSTMLPGTMDEVIVPVIERASGLRSGIDFGLGYMPEFLREGQGVADFMEPIVSVVGTNHPDTLPMMRELAGNSGQSFEVDFRTAETIKFTNNAWHALKIAFANEIGAISKASGIDGRTVMDILCADTKLNTSRAYLRPGFAFGGSCLPKDVSALTRHAQALGVQAHVLSSVMASNAAHVARAIEAVAGFGKRRVALLGLTFKPGTDDLRDSPLVELAERLIGKGFDLRIFDPNFAYADIMGRNRQFILTALPHLSTLLVDSLVDALEHAETVIVGHGGPAFADLAAYLGPEHAVFDAASGPRGLAGDPRYHGICW